MILSSYKPHNSPSSPPRSPPRCSAPPSSTAPGTLDDRRDHHLGGAKHLGLCWPREVAPADVHVVAIGKNEAIPEFADRLATTLASAGARVLYDDRADLSAGVKLKDAELIGVPTVVIVGRGLAEGTVEVRDRRSGATERVPAGEIADHLVDRFAVSSPMGARWADG